MLREFRDFVARGNVLDLAVAVIIGAAFATITASLTDDIIMPVIGAIFGGLDFSSYFTLLGPIPADYAGSPTDYAALKKAGVPIVAGTDGYGMELVRELELYVDGGMTPAQALSTATIVAARNVGVDKRTGSIAVGKEADLILVDGDVSTDLGALRRVVTVVSDGYVMDADALRKAAGYSGRPK